MLRSTSNLFSMLEMYVELEKDKSDLKKGGLSQEEIDGYVEMFLDNYISNQEVIDDNLRIPVSGLSMCSGKMGTLHG